MAEQNPDLLKQAAELNIEVTETATDEAIQAAIDEVLAEDGKTPEAGQSVIGALRETYREVIGKNAFNGWDAVELQKRIDAVRPGTAPGRDPLDHDGDGKKGGSKPKAKAPALIAVQVRRDFWDQTGTRHRKGSVVEVSVDAALDGVEVGALSRVR